MNKDILRIETKILNIVTEIFIGIMLLIFPFVVDETGFFKILEIKWYSHLIIVVAYFAVILSVLVYFSIYKRQYYLKCIKLSKAQIAIIIYMIIATISCFASPYFNKYDLFIGVGRGEGLINTLLYSGSFLAITLFGKFDKKQMTFISISSIIFNFICVLQYFGANPFNMYQYGIGTHNVSFIGTVGNLDSVSMILCLYITISFMSYVLIKLDKWQGVLHLISVVLGVFIFQIIDVDSGKVALLAVLMLMFPYIILKSEYLRRTLHLVAGIICGFLIDYVVNLKYYYSTDKLVVDLQFGVMGIALLISVCVILILAYYLRKIDYNLANNKKIIWLIYGIIFVGILLVLITLYFCDFSISILHDIHELLHGNISDELGTYRGFLWKRTLKLIKDAPLIGTGPDTFAVRFMSVYKQDVANLGKLTINDTAANVYLTLAINVGILGLLAYMFFAVCIIIKLIKIVTLAEMEPKLQTEYKYYIICALACVSLLIQDCFNLWVVIVTPLLFVMFAITHNALEHSRTNILQNIDSVNS